MEKLLGLKVGDGESIFAMMNVLTDGKRNVNTIRAINGMMGLSGEAGEATEILKKHLFQGHSFDKEHIAKELGDVAWYLAVTADAIGYDLETIFKMNIDKLENRYPGKGFDSNRSIHREDGDI